MGTWILCPQIKSPLRFILGYHQHRAQKADDIKKILNIMDEKETHVNIRFDICDCHCFEVINVGGNIINATLREVDAFSV